MEKYQKGGSPPTRCLSGLGRHGPRICWLSDRTPARIDARGRPTKD